MHHMRTYPIDRMQKNLRGPQKYPMQWANIFARYFLTTRLLPLVPRRSNSFAVPTPIKPWKVPVKIRAERKIIKARALSSVIILREAGVINAQATIRNRRQSPKPVH